MLNKMRSTKNAKNYIRLTTVNSHPLVLQLFIIALAMQIKNLWSELQLLVTGLSIFEKSLTCIQRWNYGKVSWHLSEKLVAYTY